VTFESETYAVNGNYAGGFGSGRVLGSSKQLKDDIIHEAINDEDGSDEEGGIIFNTPAMSIGGKSSPEIYLWSCPTRVATWKTTHINSFCQVFPCVVH
jgi:hypothetical protein